MELIEIESVKNGMWMSLIDALQEDVTEKMLICRRREIICQDNVIASGLLAYEFIEEAELTEAGRIKEIKSEYYCRPFHL